MYEKILIFIAIFHWILAIILFIVRSKWQYLYELTSYGKSQKIDSNSTKTKSGNNFIFQFLEKKEFFIWICFQKLLYSSFNLEFDHFVYITCFVFNQIFNCRVQFRFLFSIASFFDFFSISSFQTRFWNSICSKIFKKITFKWSSIFCMFLLFILHAMSNHGIFWKNINQWNEFTHLWFSS